MEPADANAVDVFKKIYSSGLATTAMALQLCDPSVSWSAKMMVGMQHFADWLLDKTEDLDDGQGYRSAQDAAGGTKESIGQISSDEFALQQSTTPSRTLPSYAARTFPASRRQVYCQHHSEEH